MKIKFWLLASLTILLSSGCVSSQKYNARLAEIDNFKKDVSTLEETLKATEAEKARLEGELSALKKNIVASEEKLKTAEAEKVKLEEDLSLLKKEHEEQAAKKKSLEEKNININRLLEAKKDELTKEIVSLKEKLSKTERHVEELKNEIRSKDMQVAELKAEIEGLSKEKSKAIEEKEKAIAEFKKTHDSLVSELTGEIKKGEIAITQLRDKLSVNMVDKILFDSGSAEIKKEGKKVLKRVGDILKKVTDKQIKVEGHTDNVPISQKLAVKFPTNWELSTARATNVARYLQESIGIDPRLLTVAGYSEYRPIESNDSEKGKAKNRRIEIVLIPLDIDRITKGQ